MNNNFLIEIPSCSPEKFKKVMSVLMIKQNFEIKNFNFHNTGGPWPSNPTAFIHCQGDSTGVESCCDYAGVKINITY